MCIVFRRQQQSYTESFFTPNIKQQVFVCATSYTMHCVQYVWWMCLCDTAVVASRWVTVAWPSCGSSSSSRRWSLQDWTTSGWRWSASRGNIEWTTSHRPSTERSWRSQDCRCHYTLSWTSFHRGAQSWTDEHSPGRRTPHHQLYTQCC